MYPGCIAAIKHLLRRHRPRVGLVCGTGAHLYIREKRQQGLRPRSNMQKAIAIIIHLFFIAHCSLFIVQSGSERTRVRRKEPCHRDMQFGSQLQKQLPAPMIYQTVILSVHCLEIQCLSDRQNQYSFSQKFQRFQNLLPVAYP